MLFDLPATVATPVLAIDADVLERNIARMADQVRGRSVRLRPHAKSHKSPHIAVMQVVAGAVGVCCAKLGEAEVMVSGGIDDVLVTTPVVGAAKIGRLVALAARANVAVVADDLANVRALGSEATARKQNLGIVIEIDVGQNRCGVRDDAQAVALAHEVARHPNLTLVGLQGYNGRIQMEPDVAARRHAAEISLRRLQAAVAALTVADHRIAVLTGGGTGTSAVDIALAGLTELQPGSYVFMDARYRAIGWTTGEAPPFEQSLAVIATVVSAPEESRVIVDAGWKALSSDSGPPSVPTHPGWRFEFAGDEHGALVAERPLGLRVGDQVVLQPSHCDTTVNLHDRYAVFRSGKLAEWWPIVARGRSD